MADELQILDGSFKGIQIAIASGSVDGGRKTVVHSFPSRDTQSVEDLGLQPRRYSLELVIRSDDYFGYRNRLLAALESSTPGDLIHPLYGRIANVKATTYSLNESMGDFGAATISANFEVDDSTGIPQVAADTVSQARQGQQIVAASVQADIAGRFDVTPGFAGNFAAAADKVSGLIGTARTATEFVGEASDEINEFSALLGNLSADVNALVTEPAQLAFAVVNLFENINGLYASADGTFESMRGLFGFGASDPTEPPTTAGLAERATNRDVLNGAANALALSYAYLAATEVTVETTDDIDALGEILNDQYQIVQNSGVSDEVKSDITDLRVTALQVLNAIRITLPQILTVETHETTFRLLAFDYYGTDEDGELLQNLNSSYDPSFVSGEVRILTA